MPRGRTMSDQLQFSRWRSLDPPSSSTAGADDFTKRGSPPAPPPRRAAGPALLHRQTAGTQLTNLLKGIRIAADKPKAVVSKWLTLILPQGEIWTWHFLAGLALFFCGTSYLLYMRRSSLTRRAAPKRLKVLLLPAARKLKLAALNVGLHWLLYCLVLILTGTGIMLYIGYGNWLIYIHSTAAFVTLGYIFVHVTLHYLMGGVWQLLRIVRPARLVVRGAMRPRPLLLGLCGAISVVAAIAVMDWSTRD